MNVESLPDHLSAASLAALAAPLQAVPERFQAYFGDEVEEIAAEIEEVPDWRAHTWVVTDAGRVVAWVIAEHDEEVGRVWWWGPVVADGHDWAVIGEALLDAAIERIADRFDQFEFAVDARHDDAIGLAERRGYRRDTGSVLLELATPTEHSMAIATSCRVEPLGDPSADEVAALHDEVFPDTHLTGRQLVAGRDDLLLVALVDDRVAGYLRAEIQPGGGGYIDFVGVDPRRRGAGVGRALVDRSIDALAQRGATTVSLTVREDNVAARALYARLGFDGHRVLVPLRVGFAA